MMSDFPGIRESLPSWMPSSSSEVSTGTTLVAVQFKDGVVLGADSKTSTGTLVANRMTDKLAVITDRIMACRSGSAADTQAVTEVVKYRLGFHEVEMGRPAKVQTAAFMFKEILYEYRDSLTAGLIIAGWDEVKGGQIYSIPLGGMCVQQRHAIGGSGSTFIYGYMDANYKDDMSEQEAMDLVLKCVTLAIRRDGSSGGVCRLASITKDGVKRKCVLYPDLPQF